MNAKSAERQEDTLDLFDAPALLWRRRWWLLLVTCLIAGLFTFLAFTMTPIYRTTVVVAPAGQERTGLGGVLSSALGSFGGLASLAGVNVNGSASGTEEALAVLRSGRFAAQFIDDQKLLPVLFAGKWDDRLRKWKVPEDKIPSLAQAAKYFLHDVLNVTQDKKTGLITVQVEWRDRVAAAQWANELVRRLNSVMRDRAIENSEASLAYLRKELDSTSVVETRLAISRLIEAQINQKMISSVTKEFSLRVVEPAILPDRGDTVRPNKLLLILFGVFSGLFLSAGGTISLGLIQRTRRHRSVQVGGGIGGPDAIRM